MQSFARSLVGVLLCLSASACCGGGSHHDEGGRGNTKSSDTSTTARATATISAPNNPDGSPRRGIVRSAADFKASEVTRLNNGTSITILEELHGGWLRIEWNGGSGFIHHDVVRR